MSDTITLPGLPKLRPAEEVEVRRQPPYHVILLNDDHHSFEFVIEVLRKALGFS